MKKIWRGPQDGSSFFIPTYMGKAVDPIDPDIKDFHIIDIATGLSNLCRWSGQTKTFYSVAEHSLWVSYLVPEHWAIEGLMHDAAEAYVNDIVRCVKKELPLYNEIEKRVMAEICEAFSLYDPLLWPDYINAADNDVGNNEIRDLVTNGPERYPTCKAETFIDLTGPRMTPEVAKKAFLERFLKLLREDGRIL
jgi:hypothetical protein